MALHPGPKFKIGDSEYVVPALSLGQLRGGILETLQKHDELVANNKAFDAVLLRGEVILAALRRNYPDFDETLLFDSLDMSNTAPIWLSVLGLSGFSPSGEAEAAGAAKADGT